MARQHPPNVDGPVVVDFDGYSSSIVEYVVLLHLMVSYPIDRTRDLVVVKSIQYHPVTSSAAGRRHPAREIRGPAASTIAVAENLPDIHILSRVWAVECLDKAGEDWHKKGVPLCCICSKGAQVVDVFAESDPIVAVTLKSDERDPATQLATVGEIGLESCHHCDRGYHFVGFSGCAELWDEPFAELGIDDGLLD